MIEMGYELIGCYIFSFWIEGIVLWKYASAFFEPKRQAWIRLAMIFPLYLGLFAATQLHLKLLNTLLYFLANFIFLFSQYYIKWYFACFHAGILVVIMGACELVPYYIIECYAPSFFTRTEDFSYLFLFAILSKVTFLVISYLLIHFLKGWKNYNEQQDKFALLLVFTPIASGIVMVTFFKISDAFPLSPSLNGMVSLSAFLLLAVNLMVFEINQYNQRKNAELTEMQILLQKESQSAEYYRMLRQQNESQGILIHDMKKHLQSIAMLNGQAKNDKVEAYVQQLLASPSLRESVFLCSHELLNAILCRYQQECAKQGIGFYADIRSKTTEFMEDQYVTALFCNLLDNAYEATAKMPKIAEPYIEISTSKQEKSHLMLVTVINSCPKNPFPKTGGKLATTKTGKQFHGLGLKSVRRVVDKYQGHMKLYYDEETLTFHTIVALMWSGKD